MNAIVPFRQTAAISPFTPAPTTSPAKAKLDELIETGRTQARKIVDRIYKQQPYDMLVKGESANFALTDAHHRPGIFIKDEDGDTFIAPFHAHALGQVADRVSIPRPYVERLRAGGDATKRLLIHNFNQLYWTEGGRYLVRVAQGEVRGFLSDKYRRMDSRPIVEAFVKAVKSVGAVPYGGVLTDLSFSLRAILPVVHEPVRGEALAFGLELCSSDFGARALSVSLFVLRIRCANLAVFSEDLRKVHLGARLGDDAAFSQKTYELDTATIASAVADIVKRNLLPERLETITGLIRQAAGEHVTPDQLTPWLKKHLSKAEAEAVTNAFNSPEIEMLPPGQNRWRFSNALSWFAATLESDGERRIDIERLAGQFLAEADTNRA